MNERRAFALTWRPKTFADVAGQPHVVQTLTNALAAGTLTHAYLFTGPRGVGKTTCARILARAVNCEKGAGPEPCGECGVCKDILAGRSLDVIEIDAASNRGIDEVRDLREVVRLAPARARRKVFILDEAHMLTPAACNALLKTLEEPPAHVMFILATTNALDLLPTIHSRCQRFDFKPLGLSTIVTRLKTIAAAEKLTVEEAALPLLARAARGAMRDAQTLLEQVGSFGSGQITAASVRQVLGLVESEWVERFLAALKERDVKGGLTLLDQLLESGRSPEELLGEVQEELRDALMRRLGAEVAPGAASGLLAEPDRAGWFGEEELLALLAHVRRALDELSGRGIAHPRIAAELAVARLMRRERPLSWDEVEAQLGRLGTTQTPTGVTPPPGPSARPAAPSGFAAAPSSAPGWKPPVPAARPVPAAPAGPTGPVAPADLARRWPELLERIQRESPAVFAYLRAVTCRGLEGATLILETASAFHRQGLETGEMRAQVEAALAAFAGAPVAFAVRAPAAPTVPGGKPPAASLGAAALKPPPAPAQAEWLDQEPAVKAALDIFRGRILDVKKPPARP